MSPQRRDLMFRVMDGDPRVSHYLYHLDQFHKCDLMLNWLIQNRLTGREFLNWARFHFGASILDMCRFILGHLEKNREYRPILLGKDMK